MGKNNLEINSIVCVIAHTEIYTETERKSILTELIVGNGKQSVQKKDQVMNAENSEWFTKQDSSMYSFHKD